MKHNKKKKRVTFASKAVLRNKHHAKHKKVSLQKEIDKGDTGKDLVSANTDSN